MQAALTISIIGSFSGYPSPLKPVQLLWVNLIMDTMGALALGTEHPTMELLDRRPYSRDCSLISHKMWRSIFTQAALQLVVLMILLYSGASIFGVKPGSDHHYTIVFNAFVFLQLFNEINSRKVNGGTYLPRFLSPLSLSFS